MKKYNLLKVIAVTIFVSWLLTLIIPGSFADYSGAITKGTIKGIGVYQLLSNLSVSISYFNGIAVFLVAIAVFYSVLGKLDVYNNFVSKTASLFADKKGLLVTITTVIFGILACVVSDALILIFFIPFVYKVMKELEIDKKVILSSTIVASLVGAMAGIYDKTLFTVFSLKLNTLLLIKVILLVISLVVLTMFIVPKKDNGKKAKKSQSKKESKKVSVKKVTTKEKKVNKVVYAILTILLGCIGVNKFYAGKKREGIISLLLCWTFVPFVLSIAEFITVLTEKADKKGEIPASSERRTNVLFITSLIVLVLFVIGSIIPWESLFTKLKVFTNFNTTLSNLKIGGYSVFSNIIGSPLVPSATGQTTGVINVFGSWAMTDIAILLLIISPIIALYNKMSINDFISTITSGIKKILPVAITAMLISIVLVIMVTSGVGVTIVKWILSLAKGFNIITVTIGTVVGGVLVSDFYYFLSTLGTAFTTTVTNTDYYGALAFIVQAIYNLTMIIAPTSVGLIIGLYYLDIPYNKWLKYIWKVLLVLLLVVIVMAIVIYAVL